MSTFMAIEANNAISSAINGLKQSSRQMQIAAKDIASNTIKGASEAAASSDSSSSRLDYVRSIKDTVTLSEFDRPVGIEGALVSALEAGVTYTSNARVVQAANENLGTLLNIYV